MKKRNGEKVLFLALLDQIYKNYANWETQRIIILLVNGISWPIDLDTTMDNDSVGKFFNDKEKMKEQWILLLAARLNLALPFWFRYKYGDIKININPEMMKIIKDYCRKLDAIVNDPQLASDFMAMEKAIKWSGLRNAYKGFRSAMKIHNIIFGLKQEKLKKMFPEE